MNELMSDRRSQQIDIAFAQKRIGKNNDWMCESDSDWNGQRFRAKHFHRTRTGAKFELTTFNNRCDSIVQIEFDSITLDVSRSRPGLDELEDAKQEKSKIDCEQRESKCLVQQKCGRQCGCGAGKV